MAVIEFVEIDLAAQRIAVNTQQSCCARLIAVGAVKHAFDELFFELVDSLAEKNSSVYHDAD